MSEEQKKPPQEGDAPDLGAAFRELGERLEAAFHATVTSDRVKQARRDLESGVRELASQVNRTIDTLQGDPRVQQAEERGRQAVRQAQQSDVVQTLQEALASGIKTINVQLGKLVERLEQENKPATSTPTQEVPIDREPSTGETTKLD